jgi:hypothetical protein
MARNALEVLRAIFLTGLNMASHEAAFADSRVGVF